MWATRLVKPISRCFPARQLHSAPEDVCQLIAARLEHPDRVDEWDRAYEERQKAASKTAMNAMLPGEPSLPSTCSDGLLQGVPVTFKASFCVEDTVSDACSKILDGYVAPYTGTSPQRLLDAGARMMGKCNQDEFAMGASSTFSRYGRVVNPHSPGLLAEDSTEAHSSTQLSAGGSSGGSAASVAAGTSLVSLGSDTGGSVRQPAAFCGVVGFKPTYGRLSRHGLIAFASSLDTPGIITRTVADAALCFDVMAGHDPADDTTIRCQPSALPTAEDISRALHNSVADGNTAHGPSSPSSCFSAELIHGRLPTMSTSSSAIPAGLLAHMRGKRVGIPAQCAVAELPEAIMSAWKQSAQWLEDAGAEIVPVSIPLMQQALSAYYILAPAEAASNLARYDGVRYGLRIDPQKGASTSVGKERAEDDDENGVSGLEQMYSATRSAGFGPEVQRRILTGNIVLSSSRRAEFYDAAARLRVELRHAMDQLFHASSDDKRVDFLLTPTTPSLPWELPRAGDDIGATGSGGDPVELYLADVMTVSANLADLPAVSIPVGTAAIEPGAAVAPVGMQLMGARQNEFGVLRAAAAMEWYAGHRMRQAWPWTE